MAKVNLLPLRGYSYYFDGVFSVGAYVKDNQVILIDSGISKDLAKEIDKTLIEKGLRVAAIINTHCHGDHSGGNAYFQQKYPEVSIYCTETEKPFIEDPLLAPTCFCCGAAAFEEIKKCKPITPQQPSKVTHLIAPYVDQKIEINGAEFEILTLPGHTRGMIAVKTVDGVLYCGDALFGQETFKKHFVLFYTFIEDTFHSFQKLKKLAASINVAVLYHGGVAQDFISLIDEHEKRLLATREAIIEFLKMGAQTLEELTSKMMVKFEIPDSLVAYTLTRTPIQAYLADLEKEKAVQVFVQKGICKIKLA